MPQSRDVEGFLTLVRGGSIGGLFNPWSTVDLAVDADAGAAGRRVANLRAALRGYAPGGVDVLLVGEAPGYRGLRFSGVAFVSERMLAPEHRTSREPRGYAEVTATVVRSALADLGLGPGQVATWNAVPFHPHRPGRPLSNRPPTRAEIAAGRPYLEAMVTLARPAVVVAVGRTAEAALPGAAAVRHPAQGGATAFRAGLAALLGPEPRSETTADHR